MYEYNAKIINVVDGDTFDLDIDLGFHIHIHERVRLLNIDCPEKTARNGEDEKEFGIYITNWAKRELLGREVRIVSYKGTDSFGRWLVEMLVDWGDDFTPIIYTYNVKGFNKLVKNYNLEKSLEKIRKEKEVECE